MPQVQIYYTTDPNRAEDLQDHIKKIASERKRRVLIRRVFLGILGAVAIMLRFGLQPTLLLKEISDEKVTDIQPSIYQEWYKHPALIFVVFGIFGPIPLLAIVASEPDDHNLKFLVKLISRYCEYLQGLFSTSIFMDLLQMFLRAAPQAEVLNAMYYHIQGQRNDSITTTDKLSLPSYQAAITAYGTCFCLMAVNRSLNSRFHQQPILKIILRIIVIGVVAPIIAAISFECYDSFITSHLPNHVEFYYLSVVFGMIIAIFEVQGTDGFEYPINHYYTVLRFARGGQLPPTVDLNKQQPPPKSAVRAMLEHHIGAECYRHHQMVTEQYYRYHARSYAGKNVGA